MSDYSEKKVPPSPYRRAPGYKGDPNKFEDGLRGGDPIKKTTKAIEKAFTSIKEKVFGLSEFDKQKRDDEAFLSDD